MIKNWLGQFDPIATILDTSRSIRGARLFEEDAVFESAFLFVGRTRDFLPTSDSTEVMMIHGNDIISVHSDDLNKVFNQILLAFDYYDDLERRLSEALFKAHPEQEAISACEELLGPTFIIRKDYRILACSQNFTDKPVNRFWNSFVIDREVSLEDLGAMRDSVVNTRIINRKPSMLKFREPNAAPYDYGLANTYRTAEGSVIGHLIIASNREITQFECDIASILMDALENIQEHGRHESEESSAIDGNALLAKVLDDESDYHDMLRFQATCKVQADDPIRAICFEVEDHRARPLLRDAILRAFESVAATEYEGCLYALVWGEDSKIGNVEQACSWLVGQMPMRVGVSNPSTNMEACPALRKQALHALSRSDNAIALFSTCAYEYLLAGDSDYARSQARHPGVIELERLDAENGSQLAATLREYLLCERRVGEVARRMFVHKNTVVYRIGQIKSREIFDLDDVYERNYILLSLML